MTTNFLLAFTWGLNIPQVSFLCILVMFLLNGFVIQRTGVRIPKPILSISLLMAFLLPHYALAAIYEITPLPVGLMLATLFIMSYLIGVLIASQSNESNRFFPPFVYPLLGLLIGYTVFTFLTASQSLATTASIINLDRSAPSFWTNGEPLNGPVLGILASLGICILPLLFLDPGDPAPPSYLAFRFLVIPITVAVGIYSNLVFQNRSPFLALLLAMAAAYALHFVRMDGPIHAKIKVLLKPLVVLITVCVLVLLLVDPIFFDLLLLRFQMDGVRTERTTSWMVMIQNMPLYPWGGKHVNFDDIYAHNLWLDIYNATGVIPFVFLLSFHLMHSPSIKRVLTRMTPLWLTIFLLVLFTSMFMACFGEPVLDASPLYFCGTCLLLGVFWGLGSVNQALLLSKDRSG